MNYEIGDIVWVETSTEGAINKHMYVIIGSDNEAVPVEYFGFVVSSNIKKSKFNSPYKFNEPIYPTILNNLDFDSIVKCDQLFTINEDEILYKLGQVDLEDLMRFYSAYNEYNSEQNN